ncbi:twin-arginine translocase TatA/TatE family subunit [Orientia tsutsugamushi]|uniref:Sec-independent protein translocase protein TatA n=2 Tax=Orientia tsutsugamushi TaxID=784 RepID=A0A2U3QX36_ORITS|nr:twin-arginine translocase TatA/TatE family subunit [Orientia tsutsugamushi]SPR05555.1 twin-arginine translocase TatA/TatE family subunit [Orientia tsutsugamushi str. Gilliam]SPR07269.1 twin-arginine translocase TatA/TatE family subunit [Orientia tsutsugamushi]
MGISSAQLLIILLIILVLFGAGRLPQVMSDLGKGIKAFKDSLDSDTKKKKKD